MSMSFGRTGFGGGFGAPEMGGFGNTGFGNTGGGGSRNRNVGFRDAPVGMGKEDLEKLCRGLRIESVTRSGDNTYNLELVKSRKTANVLRYNYPLAGTKRLQITGVPQFNNPLQSTKNTLCVSANGDISIPELKILFQRAGEFEIRRFKSEGTSTGSKYLLTFLDAKHAQIARECALGVRIRRTTIDHGRISTSRTSLSEVDNYDESQLMPVKKHKRAKAKLSIDANEFASLTSL